MLGDGLMFYIHKTRGGQVRLSLDAHPGLIITRAELVEADDKDV